MATKTIKKEVPPLKDYWTVIALTTVSHVPVKIEPVNQDGRSILMYHFSDDVWPDYDAWMRGSKEEPFGTIRKVKEASDQFKNNLHAYRIP